MCPRIVPLLRDGDGVHSGGVSPSSPRIQPLDSTDFSPLSNFVILLLAWSQAPATVKPAGGVRH